MPITETTTRTFKVTCDQEGRVQTMHAQNVTVYTNDAGDVISREAGPAEQINAVMLANLLHADDRANLATALSEV